MFRDNPEFLILYVLDCLIKTYVRVFKITVYKLYDALV